MAAISPRILLAACPLGYGEAMIDMGSVSIPYLTESAQSYNDPERHGDYY
jgi:hypothetical protein